MSRNFELLQKVSKKQQQTSSRPSAMPTYEMRPVPDAHALSREELVKFVQRVFLLPRDKTLRVVVFVGTEGGSGCTSICAGAAEALAAQVDGAVCVLDGNLRYPALHLCFSAENQKGWSDALADGEPVRGFAKAAAGENLWLIPSGSPRSRAAHLAGSVPFSRLSARIDELRKEFAYVLIDSPALNVYADAISLAQLADGVVLVLASNSTRRAVAHSLKAYLESAQVRVLGAVLNKRKLPLPQFIYDRL